jgi:ArsR family transcriptional regulator, arsenate/arsenite/antimonite-responsive transcriptional repressor
MNTVFLALSDPTRREILRLLRQRDMTAGEIADRFTLAKSTLSGHFNVLKNAGLIVAERSGTSIKYSLHVSAFQETLAAVLDWLKVDSENKEAKS